MEKNKKRAHRRRDNARMQKRARVMIEEWYFWDRNKPSDKELHEIARIFRDNMQRCSCSGCGNPRRGIYNGRLERLTMQEIRSEDSFHDQLQDYLTVDPNKNDE